MRKPENCPDAGDCPRRRKTRTSPKIRRKNLEGNADGVPNLTDKYISRELEKIFEECSSDGWDGERSYDSRYWGFAKESWIVGRAFPLF